MEYITKEIAAKQDQHDQLMALEADIAKKAVTYAKFKTDGIGEQVDLLINKYNEMYRAAMKAYSATGGASVITSNYSSATKKVNDAVITPSGQVIETSPQDYLFATKNPGSMGGGINITVNGDVSGRDLVEKVKEAIMGELSMNMQIAL
jgi:hypothetical protein